MKADKSWQSDEQATQPEAMDDEEKIIANRTDVIMTAVLVKDSLGG